MCKGLLHVVREPGHHRCSKDSRSNRHDTYAALCKFTRGRESKADDSGLGGRIRGLSDLPFIGGDRGCVDDHTALAIHFRFVAHHGRRGESQHIEGADQIDGDSLRERHKGVRSVPAHDSLAWCNSRAIHQAMQSSETLAGGVDRLLSVRFLRDICVKEPCPFP